MADDVGVVHVWFLCVSNFQIAWCSESRRSFTLFSFYALQNLMIRDATMSRVNAVDSLQIEWSKYRFLRDIWSGWVIESELPILRNAELWGSARRGQEHEERDKYFPILLRQIPFILVPISDTIHTLLVCCGSIGTKFTLFLNIAMKSIEKKNGLNYSHLPQRITSEYFM